MKKIFITFLFMSMFGCESGSEVAFDNHLTFEDKQILHCQATKFVHVEYDTHEYWVKAGTICEPEAKIFKAGNGPDMGELVNVSTDSEIYKHVMEIFNAKLSTDGGGGGSSNDQ